MSRKPTTPNDDGTPAGTNPDSDTIPVGRRWTANQDLLDIERRLVADGIDLPNRAIPMGYHPANREYDTAEIRRLIELESRREHPNKQLIGFLNELQKQ